jgi:hypothetical protein
LVRSRHSAIRSADCTEPSPTPSHIVSRISRQPVESTAIAKVGYSKRRHILEIEFVSSAAYRYLDVPTDVYRNLMTAQSKARFYDSNIRGTLSFSPGSAPTKRTGLNEIK